MKDENYINIQGWMINKLNLKWNELILYAIIYWFSQDWNSKYKWSLSYIEKALKISKNTIISNLDNLIKRNLIEKIIDDKWNLYSANIELLNNLGSAETEQGECRNWTGGSAETEHNNNKYINYNNNIISNKLDIIDTNKNFFSILNEYEQTWILDEDKIEIIKNITNWILEWKELLKFYNYWSEKWKSWKMRWQMEKTFELKRRLITWKWNIKEIPKQNTNDYIITNEF